MAGKKGRPTKYSKELAEKICSEISTTSRGLVNICEDSGMPSTVTVYSWLNNDDDFLNMYTHAREEQADLLADQIIEIADDSSGDEQINPDTGAVSLNSEFAARSRLRVDARKWKASKLAPKKYGDRIQHDVELKEQPLFPDVP